MLTSGKITSDDIGKTVYLSNSAVACQEWRVADINHDGTSGTVDLICKYNLSPDGIAYSTSAHYVTYLGFYYPNFAFRFWLNEELYNGFASDIRSSMRDMQTPYEYGVRGSSNEFYPQSIQYISEKVRCPSVIELGCTDANKPSVYIPEGTRYPIFTQIDIGTLSNPHYGSNAVITNADGSSVGFYWTRSVIPCYDGKYADTPALLSIIGGHASIAIGSDTSNSNYESYTTYGVDENATFIYYGNTPYKLGIRGIIRF